MGDFFRDDSDGALAQARRASAVRDERNVLRGLTGQVRERVVETFPAGRLMHPDEEVEGAVRDLARQAVADYAAQATARGWDPLPLDGEEVARRIAAEILGLGEIERLLKGAGVEDVVINGPREVYVYRGGGWERAPVEFEDEEQVLRMLNRAIAPTGRQVSPLEPVVDAVIPGGHRINVVMRPCAEPSPCAAIRVRRRSGFSMQDLLGRDMRRAMVTRPTLQVPDYTRVAVAGGMLSAQAATFLHYAVLAGMNVVVVGSTGVGKTSFLGALGRLLPEWLRIVVIEDTRELNVRPDEGGLAHNCVYFTTRQGGLEGTPPVTQSDLVRAALRQRPDALTLGEARGGEVLDLLKALCTGHRNGLTSVHAESVSELVSRLKLMLQEADVRTEVRDATVAEWIARAFHVSVALEMGTLVAPDGRQGKVRRVAEIVEFSGHVEGGQPSRQTLFRFDERQGHLVRQGVYVTPARERMLAAAGLDYGAVVAMDRGEACHAAP
jgi:pilus assembly protein CpaF